MLIEKELFSEINLKFFKELKKNRLFLLYAYDDFQLKNNISCKRTNPINYKIEINLSLNGPLVLDVNKILSKTNIFKIQEMNR